ncbi:MAG: hypothetical protein ACREX4_13235 [Gammaproteobacteria bacterium]
MSDLKKALITIATVVVGGIAVWLTAGGGTAYVLEWFRPVIIETTSTTRKVQDQFIAGEKIRFFLKDIHSERVFWVFDEKDMRPGNIEIEYAFPFDETQAVGITRNRRVDAFYRYGGDYRAASKTVQTHNIKHAVSLKFEPSGIRITADTALGERWTLENAKITKFEKGFFEPKYTLAMKKIAGTEISSTAVTGGELTKALAYPKVVDLADLKMQLANRKDAWITYEFLNADRTEKLAIVQPLGFGAKEP